MRSLDQLIKEGFKAEDFALCAYQVDAQCAADMATTILREAMGEQPMVAENSTHDLWKRMKKDCGALNPRLFKATALLVAITPLEKKG